MPFSGDGLCMHAGGGGEGPDAREGKYGECLTPESIGRQVQSMVDECGYKDIKLKGGVMDPAEKVEAIHQFRSHFGPDMPLRIDPNSAWTVETPVQVGTASR